VILFKVVSVDIFDRHRIEGYGYLKLDTIAGCRSIKVQTWKSDLDSKSQIKSYFVGGCPELEDLTYPVYTNVILIKK
jgi:Meckel syndrome type 1 protein